MANREMPNSDEIRKKYPPNSNANKSNDISSNKEARSEKKEIHKVANAKVRKKGIIRRIGKSIIEDNIQEARERAFSEVVVPGLKNLLYDTGRDILETILFGISGDGYRDDRRRFEGRRGESRTSYSSYYKEGRRKDRRGSERDYRGCEPDDIILDTRAQARDVLDELDYIIRKYDQASILDLYDIIGLTGDWTDKRYGWTSIRGASIKPVRDGFMLILPRTELLPND